MIDLDILLQTLEIDYAVHPIGNIPENPFTVGLLKRPEKGQLCA